MIRSLARFAFTAVLVAPFAASASAGDYIAGFEEVSVASGFLEPTSICFLEDENHFLVSEKRGRIFRVRDGVVEQPALLTLPVATESDRGIFCVVRDPGFSEGTGFVYVLYTPFVLPRVTRVSRYFVSALGVGEEEVVIDGLPSDSGQHSGGGMAFGTDGKLYVATGDGGDVSMRAQDPALLHGAILRFNADGTVPDDNPFVGVPGFRPEVFAKGFRNPWRITCDAVTGQLYVNDVGRALIEEVNSVDPGANHGWPLFEGPGMTAGFVDPIHHYPHPGGDSAAVTGGVLYRGAEYPLEFDGSYFFTDYNNGLMERLVLDEAGEVVSVLPFASGLTRPVTMNEGPDGAIYYAAFYDGEIFRIGYVGSANRRPTLAVTFSPDSDVAPFDLVFDTSGSRDPDGDPLTFTYKFDTAEVFSTSDTTFVRHMTDPRVHEIRVIVADGRGGSDRVTVHVDAENDPPVPVITAPATGTPYSGGELFSFAGFATDPEDGPLPPEALSWRVIFHHLDHTHSFLGPIDGVSGAAFRVPRGGETATSVGYEIRLDATDSRGITRSASVNLVPRLVTFRVETVPAGLPVSLDGTPTPTPFDVLTVAGVRRTLGSAGAFAGPDERLYGLWRWADFNRAERAVTVESEGIVFHGIFKPVYRY